MSNERERLGREGWTFVSSRGEDLERRLQALLGEFDAHIYTSKDGMGRVGFVVHIGAALRTGGPNECELAKELARRDFNFAYDGATGCFVVWVDEEDDAEDWAAVRSWFRAHFGEDMFGEDMAAQLVKPESFGPVAVEPGRPRR